MIDLALAVRNLLRNRRRSFATFFALAIGTASILLFGGFSANIKLSMQTAYVRTGGHLQIQHRDFFLYGSGDPTAYGIRDYRKLIEAIGADPVLSQEVLVLTPTLQFGSIAGNYEASVSRTVIGLGLVASDYNRMRNWNEFDLPQTDPPFALDGAAADAAIVGTGVARVLQLCDALKVEGCRPRTVEALTDAAALPADIADLAMGEAPAGEPAALGAAPKVELLASRAGGTPNVVSVQVIRAERQGFKELDEVYVMLQLPQAQRLVYGRDDAEATAVLVQLRHSGEVEQVKVRLEDLLRKEASDQPLVVLDFQELNPFYVQTIGMFDTIFGFIFVLIGTIVLFTVSNTMNTAVVERTVEIGTIRAIGLRAGGVQRLFVLEGGLLGISGAVSGALFALAAAAVVNQLGLTWLPPGSGDRLPLVLLVSSVPGMVVGTTVGLSLIATLSAWWPAHRAARLAIVDALRHV
jgi:putative ABC transport system permease protein